MSDLTLFPEDSTSQSIFDMYRQIRPDGSEFWSARDLMPLYEYEKWERFYDAIDRAKVSASTQGFRVDDHFPASGKVIIGGRWGQQTVADYELTRFAAYLVAMNGDPRKPAIASAQAYFAIQTRKQEIAETVPAVPQTYAQALRAAADAVEAKEVAEQRARAAEGFKSAIEANDGIAPRIFHKKYFSDTSEREFFEVLYKRELLIDQRGARGRDDKGNLRNGRQHGHPAYQGKPYFYLHGSIGRNGDRHETARVRPGDPELALVAHLSRWLAPSRDTTPALEYCR